MTIAEFIADVKKRSIPVRGLDEMRRRTRLVDQDLPILLMIATKSTEALNDMTKSDSQRARYLSEKTLSTIQWWIDAK